MKCIKNLFTTVGKRAFAFLLAAVLLLSAVPALRAIGSQDGTVERLNVMLVIDGSGSLPAGTDTKGLRYEAIDLFLALLTNQGNNVGAIVFNDTLLLETECDELVGKAEKMNLSQQIRDAGAKGGTDIGKALSAAVDKTIAKRDENKMNSVIILFSDGRTDVYGGEEAMNASLETKRLATQKAQDNGIPVYSICLNASDTASPDELREISQQTSGSFVEVNKAEDLTPAFEAFYNLIFPNTCNKLTQTTFSGEGTLSTDIAIPAYGAEEVNIILNMTNVTGIDVVSPDGVYSPEQIENTTMSGGYYDVIKLVEPLNGKWQVNLSGKPGTEVTINVLYNIDSTAELTVANGQTDYNVGESVQFRANLLTQGQVVTDSTVVQEYEAKLHLTNLSTGVEKVVNMTPENGGTFAYSFLGEDYCSWSAYVELVYSHLVLTSNEVAVNFGNTAPVASPDYTEVSVKINPFSEKIHTMNIADFFSDAQDSLLTYSIVSSQLIQDTATLDSDTGELVVNVSQSKSGNVVIEAKDSQGATAQMTVKFDVKNQAGLIYGGGGLLLVLLIVGLILFFVLRIKSWSGMLTVETIDGSITRNHGGFRGKLSLTKLGIRGCGVDGELVALKNNRLEFRSKAPIYSGMGIQSNPKVISLMEGPNEIYGDEAHSFGIEIQVDSMGAGFGGGGNNFGGGGFTFP
ncbi:MAG: VWA domain-containing protein [Oscillospiraceae bacterium]|nr:VWA domain-containing protein [Oscillospiraceae bacterium]